MDPLAGKDQKTEQNTVGTVNPQTRERNGIIYSTHFTFGQCSQTGKNQIQMALSLSCGDRNWGLEKAESTAICGRVTKESWKDLERGHLGSLIEYPSEHSIRPRKKPPESL